MARVINRQQTAVTVTLPAPTLGLNSRDAWADMDPRFATAMVNLFPTPSSVQLRKGYAISSTVTSGGVPMERFVGFVKYGDETLFGAWFSNPGVVINLLESLAGTEVTSFSSGKAFAQLANGAGTFVVVAGSEYWTFDGTTWTDNTASLVANTRDVVTFRNRLWFAKTTGLSAWYLPTSAITGTLVEFPLGGVARRGGQLSYIGTWTLDGGVGGMDDRIVFITSNGEAIVYEGIDPASPTTFSLVGVFDVSKPVAPPLKYGTDLLLVCDDGLYSMTEIISGNTGTEYAVSSQIRADWQEAVAASSPSFGVNTARVTVAYSAKLNVIVANIPTPPITSLGPQTSIWFVMNTITKAWTKFTGLDAWAVCEFQGDIYFATIAGSVSFIGKWGTATDDNGSAITGYARQAYSNLGLPGVLKQVTGILPSFTVTGSHTVGTLIERDFRSELTTSSTPTNERAYATGSYRPMLFYPVVGENLAPFFEASSSASNLKWYSTTLLFNRAGIV
jgi:hypothetical protein